MKAPIHKLIWLFTLSCILLTPCAGQEEMKWGIVSVEQLRMNRYAQDPEANAVVLGDVGLVEYEFRSDDRPVRFERHVRIKLLTQAAVAKYGNVKILYYSRKHYAILKELKAQIFLPGGRIIPVSDENIFKDKEDSRFTIQTIAFPSLEPGAIIEYKYTIVSGDVYTPVDWFFEREIPIVYSELTTRFPRWFDYVVLQQGRPIDDHKVSATNVAVPGGGLLVVFQEDKYVSRNLSGLKEEQFITTMNNYRSRLRYQLREISKPDKPPATVMETWQAVEKQLLQRESFGRVYLPFKNGDLVLSFAGMTVDGPGSHLDKAKQLFQYLSAHLRWNGVYDVGTSESMEELLTSKEGNSTELNLILLAGLRILGIDAAPVITSTRSNGRPVELYPFEEQFDHVFVQATIDGKDYFLDVAADQPFGIPRYEALNYRGWRMERDSSQWIDVYPELSRTTYFLKLNFTPQGELEGTVQAKFSAYHASRERGAYRTNRAAYFKDQLMSNSHVLKVDQFEFQNEGDVNLPFSLFANIKGEPRIEANDFLYLSLPCIQVLNTNPLTEAERKFPIEIEYPYVFKLVVDVQIPEGFIIESLPGNVALKTEDEGITFTYRCSESPGRVQMLADFTVSKLQYAPEHYGILKLMFDQIVSATGEQIVLKKNT